MEENGLKRKDLVNWIGSKGYGFGIINRKKATNFKNSQSITPQVGNSGRGAFGIK